MSEILLLRQVYFSLCVMSSGFIHTMQMPYGPPCCSALQQGRFSFQTSSIAGPEAEQGGHQQGPLFSLQITQHPAASSQLPGLGIKCGPFSIGSCWVMLGISESLAPSACGTITTVSTCIPKEFLRLAQCPGICQGVTWV